MHSIEDIVPRRQFGTEADLNSLNGSRLTCGSSRDIVANGTAATKKNEQDEGLANNFNNVPWDCADDGYGSYTYSAVVENTTQYTDSNVTITLGLYDADGVRQDEAYTDVNSWAPGEKVRFEAYGTVSAQTVKVEPTYYEAE